MLPIAWRPHSFLRLNRSLPVFTRTYSWKRKKDDGPIHNNWEKPQSTNNQKPYVETPPGELPEDFPNPNIGRNLLRSMKAMDKQLKDAQDWWYDINMERQYDRDNQDLERELAGTVKRIKEASDKEAGETPFSEEEILKELQGSKEMSTDDEDTWEDGSDENLYPEIRSFFTKDTVYQNWEGATSNPDFEPMPTKVGVRKDVPEPKTVVTNDETNMLPLWRKAKIAADGSSIGRGGRKSSSATVWIRPNANGDGRILVNNRPLAEYFPGITAKDTVVAPLLVTENLGHYDVKINVRGGGFTGQAGACSLGLARALQKQDPEYRPTLKKAGLLTRDSRSVERKKPGQPKARKKFQWGKR